MAGETKLKNKIRPLLKQIPESYWEKIQQVAKRGNADFFGCVRGRFVALELKGEGGVVAKLQTHKLRQVKAAGGYAKVVTAENWPKIYKELLHAW